MPGADWRYASRIFNCTERSEKIGTHGQKEPSLQRTGHDSGPLGVAPPIVFRTQAIVGPEPVPTLMGGAPGEHQLLYLQRVAGNRATVNLLQRALRRDPSSQGARSYEDAQGTGATVDLDTVLKEILVARPDLAGLGDAIRKELEPFTGDGLPDLVFGPVDSVLDWLKQKDLQIPDKPRQDLDMLTQGHEEEKKPAEEGEVPYNQRYETALVNFARKAKQMDFSGGGSMPRYDKECWSCTLVLTPESEGDEDVTKERQLYTGMSSGEWKRLQKQYEEVELEYTLLGGVAPSRAISRIFEDTSRWAMDCIDFVVAGRLYAQLMAMGANAFDEKFNHLGPELSPQPMKMAQHETPGLDNDAFWERDNQGQEFVNEKGQKTARAPRTGEEEDELLASLPIGTRVMWSTWAPITDDMENENAIKIGPDKYAAHPLGTVSGAKLREELVDERKFPKKAQRLEQVRTNVFLKEVELYSRK